MQRRTVTLLIFFLFLSLVSSGFAQNFFYSPEGKTFLEVSQEQILLRFNDGVRDDEKAALAARAYIRHEFTSYEDVLGDARRSCHHEDWEVIRDEAHWDAARFLRQRRTGSSAASGWCANGPGQASR